MATFTGTNNMSDFFQEDLGKKVYDIANDDLRMGLSVGATPPANSMHFVSEISGEVADTDYSRQALTGVTWVKVGALSRFDSNDVSFTASTADITAKWWWIYNHIGADTVNPIICWGLLNQADQDVSVSPTDAIVAQPNPTNGWLEVDAP